MSEPLRYLTPTVSGILKGLSVEAPAHERSLMEFLVAQTSSFVFDIQKLSLATEMAVKDIAPSLMKMIDLGYLNVDVAMTIEQGSVAAGQQGSAWVRLCAALDQLVYEHKPAWIVTSDLLCVATSSQYTAAQAENMAMAWFGLSESAAADKPESAYLLEFVNTQVLLHYPRGNASVSPTGVDVPELKSVWTLAQALLCLCGFRQLTRINLRR